MLSPDCVTTVRDTVGTATVPGTRRSCPTLSRLGFKPGFSTASVCGVSPKAAAIAVSVSPACTLCRSPGAGPAGTVPGAGGGRSTRGTTSACPTCSKSRFARRFSRRRSLREIRCRAAIPLAVSPARTRCVVRFPSAAFAASVCPRDSMGNCSRCPTNTVDRSAPPFASASASRLVAKRSAIPLAVSPTSTTYVRARLVPVGVDTPARGTSNTAPASRKFGSTCGFSAASCACVVP